MAKIQFECERRSLRGCSGCSILHSFCAPQQKKNDKRREEDKRWSLQMANEEMVEFFTEAQYAKN